MKQPPFRETPTALAARECVRQSHPQRVAFERFLWAQFKLAAASPTLAALYSPPLRK